MKIEINKHYSIQNNGEIICITDYPKDTQKDAENFAQCIENQVLDISTSDGLLAQFIKCKDCQSYEIVNAVKNIVEDNEFTVFHVLNLVNPWSFPHKMINMGNRSSIEIARLICE